MSSVYYHDGQFPPKDLDWERLIPLIGSSNAAVARYDGTLLAIPNPSVLLSPLTTQEAVLSSRIEGTRATMGEVLEFEARGDSAGGNSEKEADIWEIINYRKAMQSAVEMLKDMPLCQRVIRNVHKILMNSVRGHGKSPGKYRKIPNWIGPPRSTIENAKFVPVSAEKLPEAMSNWEKYIHKDSPDRLVQLAIVHAEFEALHPFLDGNGRLGRMCIPLFMFSQKLIDSPMFYISAFFESNRDEYYERLLAVSRDSDWTGWVIFFLKAVQAQANDNQKKAIAILKLYDEMKIQIPELTHSQYAIHALDWLFGHPIFKSSDFIRSAGIPKATAIRILSLLKENNVLETIEGGKGRRSAILAYVKLLNIAEGYKAF